MSKTIRRDDNGAYRGESMTREEASALLMRAFSRYNTHEAALADGQSSLDLVEQTLGDYQTVKRQVKSSFGANVMRQLVADTERDFFALVQ